MLLLFAAVTLAAWSLILASRSGFTSAYTPHPALPPAPRIVDPGFSGVDPLIWSPALDIKAGGDFYLPVIISNQPRFHSAPHRAHVRRKFSPLWYCGAVLGMISRTTMATSVVIENARYLRNSGGIHVGHWVNAVTQFIPHLHQLATETQGHDTFRSPRYATVELYLEDGVRSAKQLRAIDALLLTNRYVRFTLEAAERAFGANLTITASSSSSVAAVRVNARRWPTNDRWWKSGGLQFTNAALQVSGCNPHNAGQNAGVSDVLIYNRKGSRRIENFPAVTQFLQANGMTTTVVTVTSDLTPEQQICVISKPYKFIVTPHGGQMASLLFKHPTAAVVVVSPPKGVLETFRFFRPAGEPWFAVQEARMWRCRGFCVDTARRDAENIGATLLPPDCEHCERKLRYGTIKVNLRAVKKIVLEARGTKRLRN
jgi:hypothetical protein